jgi:ribose 5-phosphate isomerase B
MKKTTQAITKLPKLKFLIASDHAGRDVKLKALKAVQELGYDFYDCSPKNKSDDDYPDFAKMVASEVATTKDRYGILVCGTGIGMSIAANKIKGVRAALCAEKKDVTLSRMHNDSNILIFTGWKKHSQAELKEMIKLFAETKFEGGRHLKRLQKISEIESALSS